MIITFVRLKVGRHFVLVGTVRGAVLIVNGDFGARAARVAAKNDRAGTGAPDDHRSVTAALRADGRRDLRD
jgi:hypothetical protein